MSLTFQEYKDKVRACWLGKNVGGTLGAPFECIRGVYDLDYYTHDITKGVLPNDDLDLQLVWLNAAEKYGKNVNAEILGEYWTSYVTADWSEYGAGKNNLRYGLVPPISGWYNNHNKDSCGCFIRSEIWACLAPGHPEIAVKYAYEDAICDHADEGMYAEIFCAALESAAFVESDREKLIAAALAFIPADCAIAGVAALVKDCYEKGMTWKQARKAVMQQYPGSFGLYGGYKDQEPETDIPDGQLGYDAPNNIGLMLVGWYFGEGDFSKSICIAAGCCEDGDCTAGTLGSVLGIIGGTKIIEDKWLVPIGDEIKIISVDVTNGAMKP
ncbi:MAG: ADP-ribosylglycohydrolase family protein, partial [Firmicutes bacterium]|nr:ADP-ribosylglycohydrolase family protein [Bacillota bacterium]